MEEEVKLTAENKNAGRQLTFFTDCGLEAKAEQQKWKVNRKKLSFLSNGYNVETG